MPIFKKDLVDNSNINLYKNLMTEKHDIQLLFNFYWKTFVKDDKIFQMHPLIGKRLTKMSESYFLAIEKEEVDLNTMKNVKNIFFKNLIPIDLSPSNYLFMKFMKFHVGFLKFSQWYELNNFGSLEVNEVIMKDFLMKNFMVCLDKSKRELRDKVQNLSDFKLISNTCVKERLSLYNFLRENQISAKDAKEFINRQYMSIFRGRIYTPDLKKNVTVGINDLLTVYSNLKN